MMEPFVPFWDRQEGLARSEAPPEDCPPASSVPCGATSLKRVEKGHIRPDCKELTLVHCGTNNSRV